METVSRIKNGKIIEVPKKDLKDFKNGTHVKYNDVLYKVHSQYEIEYMEQVYIIPLDRTKKINGWLISIYDIELIQNK